MKLAFCLYKYRPYGGLERCALQIMRAAQRHDHQINCFASAWVGSPPVELPITPVPAKGISNHQRMLSFARGVAKLNLSESYDAVVGFQRMPGLDFYVAADLCVKHRAGKTRGWLYRLSPRYRTYQALEKAVFAKDAHTQILYLTDITKHGYQHAYQTPDARFHLLPPGVARQSFDLGMQALIRHTRFPEWGLGPGDKLLLMVGSNFKVKGLSRAITALAALPEGLRRRTHLFVIGQGDAKGYIRLAKRLHVSSNLRFLGARDQVYEFMAAADVLIHPASFETAGLVLLESLTVGLPVLVTENCGYAGHIKEAEAGIVVPTPFMQSQLNDALLTMLTTSAHGLMRAKALAYAGQQDLYSMATTAVRVIETGIRKQRTEDRKKIIEIPGE
jgi:UDP-glucose:(heptosyl)LPS alpha-1,3-glucosyltransferase